MTVGDDDGKSEGAADGVAEGAGDVEGLSDGTDVGLFVSSISEDPEEDEIVPAVWVATSDTIRMMIASPTTMEIVNVRTWLRFRSRCSSVSEWCLITFAIALKQKSQNAV